MRDSVYHKLLRISALTFAFILLFDSGMLSPVTRELSHDTGMYLANAIGINAGVLSTDISNLTAQLQEREQRIAEREIAVSLKEASRGGLEGMSTFILSVVLFVLLVLIVLNYVLDFMRIKERKLIKQGTYEQAA